MLDLDRVERVINRPHIIDLRADGFTLMHPPACHPHLFACPFNLATRDNLEDPVLRGQYQCSLYRGADDDDPVFSIGEPAADYEGVDWNALLAELRAAREDRKELTAAVQELLYWAKRRHHGAPGLHPEEFFRTTEYAERVLADHGHTEEAGGS